MSLSAILRKRWASPTARPLSFMKVSGFSSMTRSPPMRAFGDERLEFLAPGRKAVRVGDRFDRHEADVVAIAFVLGARISKTDEQFH